MTGMVEVMCSQGGVGIIFVRKGYQNKPLVFSRGLCTELTVDSVLGLLGHHNNAIPLVLTANCVFARV